MPILKRPKQPDLFYEIDDFADPWRAAPYLILQHGNGRSSRFWYSWVPYLSRFYRIVRPDMRGLGKSSRDFDLETQMSMEELLGDLVAIIDALGVERVHFLQLIFGRQAFDDGYFSFFDLDVATGGEVSENPIDHLA